MAWAIRDLAGVEATSPRDRASTPTAVAAARMRYLFERRLYDLPDTERPTCHRDDPSHTYRSVYGRLRWNQPAQTITTGFGCMGQGRFVHPSRPRTVTPHEAARLQFIPDFFDFGDTTRGALSRMIGNAVPPKLTYLISLALLR